jgi:hypothetical protein
LINIGLENSEMVKRKKMGMVSCIQATGLVEKKASLGLTFAEQLKLILHSAICDACRRYAKQSKQLDAILTKRGSISIPPNKTLKLDENVKATIISRLENKH